MTRISRLPNGKAAYSERDLMKNTMLTKETPIPACVHEYFGALQRLRVLATGVRAARSGRRLAMGRSRRVSRWKRKRREEVSTPLGKFQSRSLRSAYVQRRADQQESQICTFG